MNNSVRKLDKDVIEYKQNQIESALMDKKEAVKCANKLMLLAVDLLEFSGNDNEADIVYNVSSILEATMEW